MAMSPQRRAWLLPSWLFYWLGYLPTWCRPSSTALHSSLLLCHDGLVDNALEVGRDPRLNAFRSEVTLGQAMVSLVATLWQVQSTGTVLRG